MTKVKQIKFFTFFLSRSRHSPSKRVGYATTCFRRTPLDHDQKPRKSRIEHPKPLPPGVFQFDHLVVISAETRVYFSRAGDVLRMESTALFSTCRQFRYSLTRVWDNELPLAMFIGLNPSTADEIKDDPTVRRCIGFARSGGFGGIVLANLFAFRSKDPRSLKDVHDPVGPENDVRIIESAYSAARVIVAWGVHGALHDRDKHVLSLLQKPYCLGITKDGLPKHPLYLAASTKMTRLPRSCYARSAVRLQSRAVSTTGNAVGKVA